MTKNNKEWVKTREYVFLRLFEALAKSMLYTEVSTKEVNKRGMLSAFLTTFAGVFVVWLSVAPLLVICLPFVVRQMNE